MGKTYIAVIVKLFLVVSLAILTEQQISNYNQLYRTFLIFDEMPLTVPAAQAAGWSQVTGTTCDNTLGGIPYTNGGIYDDNSGFLYFTAGGQISGFGARLYSDSVPQNLVPDFWVPVDGYSNTYDISLIFRNSSVLCSGDVIKNEVLGSHISINNKIPIPENSLLATAVGWVEGNCISRMGIHYAYDLNAPGKMSWNSSSLVPVMPMYGPIDRQLKAILINTPTWQDTEPVGEWEGPFTNGLFCYNWCSSSDCTFSPSSVWSTMHWLFTDYSIVNCTGAKCSL